MEVGAREALAALADDPQAEPLEIAQQAVAALDPLERPRLVPELIPLLAHPDRGARRWARESCRSLTGLDEPGALRAFLADYEAVRRIEGGRLFEELERVRSLLRDPSSSRPLRRRALTALGRLRAVEALPDLLEALGEEPAAWRREVWSHLVGLAGGEPEPFDPAATAAARHDARAALRRWWSERGEARVLEERVRRAVTDLSLPHRVAAAERALRAIGPPALRGLVDGLRSDTTRARAHALLVELSGKELPATVEVWLDALQSD